MRYSALIAVCALVIFGGCANKSFYHPTHDLYQTPVVDGYSFEEVSFASLDGTKLTGWFIPAAGEPRGTVIHLHGNSQNMTSQYSFVSFLPKMGYNLFVFDYRGYGKSGGKVGRRGIYEDSVAAIRYIKSRKDIDQNKLFVFGQSLGGANAIAAVGNNHFEGIRGVIIDSSFYSYRSVAWDHLPSLLGPLSYVLVNDRYSPSAAVRNISPVPVLFIHGTADAVVPFHHYNDLLAKAGEPKQSLIIPNAGHCTALTTYKDKTIPRVQAFLQECLSE